MTDTLTIRLATQPGQPLDTDTVRRFLTAMGIDVTKPLSCRREGADYVYEGERLTAVDRVSA